MKVGDYVRTKTGNIYKIGQLGYNNETFMSTNDEGWYEVYKSSPNIIDLIEVGDYVNGYKVIDFMLENGKRKGVIVDADIWGFDIDEIKSIVTKEQFENMKYEVK